MRLMLELHLDKRVIPLDYRPVILSFIKKSLSTSNKIFYESLYEDGTKQKEFAFSVYLPKPIFKEGTIEIEQEQLYVLFTTPDYQLFINLYNSFIKQKHINFPVSSQNTMILNSIRLINEQKITNNGITAKFISPLVVRQHNRITNEDIYLTFNDEEFMNVLKNNLKNFELNKWDITEEMIDNFSMQQIFCEKVVVKIFGITIDTTIGTFDMRGDKKLLNYLYLTGMGSRKSQGFGVFNVI